MGEWRHLAEELRHHLLADEQGGARLDRVDVVRLRGAQERRDLAEEVGDTMASPSTYIPSGGTLGRGTRLADDAAKAAADLPAGQAAVDSIKADGETIKAQLGGATRTGAGN